MAEYSSTGSIWLDGTLIAQSNDIEWDEDSGDSPVFTSAEGLAGHSDGAAVFNASFQSAIPAAGFEHDFLRMVRNHETHNFELRIANKQYIARGRFTKASGKTAVNAPNSLSVTFNGKLVGEPITI